MQKREHDMPLVAITADQHSPDEPYQYFVEGEPTGYLAEPITAATDSDCVVTSLELWLTSRYGCSVMRVDHEGDTIFASLLGE